MKPSLLRRFRWPIFVVAFSSAQTAGIAYLYGDSRTAGIAFMVFLFVGVSAVVLNIIDESPRTIAEKYEQNQNTES